MSRLQHPLLFGLCFMSLHLTGNPRPTVDVMGPLLIADPRYTHNWQHSHEWGHFAHQLREHKRRGFRAMAHDTWMGLMLHPWYVEYYKKVYGMTVQEMGSLVIGLSTHAAGGNPGDHGLKHDIGLKPDFLHRMIHLPEGDARFQSEAGNFSDEHYSFFATKDALPSLEEFWLHFRKNFGEFLPNVAAIALGVGPTGELYYPSWGIHDFNPRDPKKRYAPAQFPYRGAMQISSPRAQKSFQEWLRKKYHTIQKLNAEWGLEGGYSDFDKIFVLNKPELVESFFRNHLQFSPFGQDVFDWQHEAMLDHLNLLVDSYAQVMLEPGSPLVRAGEKKLTVQIKVPQPYWDHRTYVVKAGGKDIWVPTRGVELTSGLIRTRGARKLGNGQFLPPSDWLTPDGKTNIEAGLGYESIFKTMAAIQRRHPQVNWEVVFTAAENANCPDRCFTEGCKCIPQGLYSRGGDLIHAYAHMSRKWKVRVRIENGMEDSLRDSHRVHQLLAHGRVLSEIGGHFMGYTLLRNEAALYGKWPAQEGHSHCSGHLVTEAR